jgi:hypothetical protein
MGEVKGKGGFMFGRPPHFATPNCGAPQPVAGISTATPNYFVAGVHVACKVWPGAKQPLRLSLAICCVYISKIVY